MNFADVPFALLRLQYEIVRIPLRLVESQLKFRLTAEAPARVCFERFFGSLDATVGDLLGDAELKKRGTALVEHATEEPEAVSTGNEVVTDIAEARDESEQRAAEARLAANERIRAAQEVADQRAAAATARAKTNGEA